MKGSRPTRIIPAAASLVAAFLTAAVLVSCASSPEQRRTISTYSVDPDKQANPSTPASSGERSPGVMTYRLEHYKVAEPYTIHHPFPQAGITRTYGLRPTVFTQREMNAHAQHAFEEWVEHWITDSNCPPGAVRPHMGPGPGLLYYSEPYGTISEFVGWGMLLTVMMDNDRNRTKGLFNSLDAYRKAQLNEYGLMMSTINYHKPMDAWNRDAATEADENMAMGLVLAHYQWGSDGAVNYLAEAKQLITAISTHLVERPSYALKPAVTWGGSGAVDPAYYDSIYYPLWFTLTGDATWTKLDEHYRFLVAYFTHKYGTGLVPEWCQADGTASRAGGNGLRADSYFYGWDAHQVSTKWAIHYAWYGRAKTAVFADAADLFAAWVKKQAHGDLTSLVNAYELNGTPIGTYTHLSGMVGAMGLSGTVSPQNQDLVNDAYRYLLTMDVTQNYGWGTGTAKLRDLLVYSGNFVNFTDLDR
jgi:endo-1,4-beta-D-glucanase Y